MKTPSNVWEVRDRLNENYNRAQQILDTMPEDSDTRSRCGVVAEVRQHIALANRASEITLALEAARVFEDAVIETLANVNPNLRKEFIRRLNEREQIWRSRYTRRPRSQ